MDSKNFTSDGEIRIVAGVSVPETMAREEQRTVEVLREP